MGVESQTTYDPIMDVRIGIVKELSEKANELSGANGIAKDWLVSLIDRS